MKNKVLFPEGSPSGPKSGFGKEKTQEDIMARIEWEVWAAQEARNNNQEAIAQGHDLARKAYEELLDPSPVYPWGNSPPKGEYTGD